MIINQKTLDIAKNRNDDVQDALLFLSFFSDIDDGATASEGKNSSFNCKDFPDFLNKICSSASKEARTHLFDVLCERISLSRIWFAYLFGNITDERESLVEHFQYVAADFKLWESCPKQVLLHDTMETFMIDLLLLITWNQFYVLQTIFKSKLVFIEFAWDHHFSEKNESAMYYFIYNCWVIQE